jgi:DNA-binding Xre family transcriptional regulator
MREEEWLNSIVEQITAQMKDQKITQRELASLVGITRLSVCNKLNKASRTITLDQLWKICEALNCNVSIDLDRKRTVTLTQEEYEKLVSKNPKTKGKSKPKA